MLITFDIISKFLEEQVKMRHILFFINLQLTAL